MRREDDRTPERVRRATREYNDPPQLSAADSDAMWSAIEKDAFPARFRSPSGPFAERQERQTPWLTTRSLVPLAAVLLLGVAIGRFALPRDAATPVTVAVRAPDADSVGVPEPYQSATSRYLGQTTALLASLPAEVRDGHADDRFMGRAHDLLLTTRLLLDSPAAADPRFRTLLEDLELVLAQVVRMPSDKSPAELDLIRQALEQRDVLPRLRNAVADISADD